MTCRPSRWRWVTCHGRPACGARRRGAARILTAETGAGLAGYVEDTFETGARPGIRTKMSADELARYGAEGAAWTLDEATAYALEGSEPVASDDLHEA